MREWHVEEGKAATLLVWHTTSQTSQHMASHCGTVTPHQSVVTPKPPQPPQSLPAPSSQHQHRGNQPKHSPKPVSPAPLERHTARREARSEGAYFFLAASPPVVPRPMAVFQVS